MNSDTALVWKWNEIDKWVIRSNLYSKTLQEMSVTWKVQDVQIQTYVSIQSDIKAVSFQVFDLKNGRNCMNYQVYVWTMHNFISALSSFYHHNESKGPITHSISCLHAIPPKSRMNENYGDPLLDKQRLCKCPVNGNNLIYSGETFTFHFQIVSRREASDYSFIQQIHRLATMSSISLKALGGLLPLTSRAELFPRLFFVLINSKVEHADMPCKLILLYILIYYHSFIELEMNNDK